MIISSSWTWYASTRDASFTPSSSLQYHQHTMIFFTSRSCLEHHQHMMISLHPASWLDDYQLMILSKVFNHIELNLFIQLIENISSTMWLSLIHNSGTRYLNLSLIGNWWQPSQLIDNWIYICMSIYELHKLYILKDMFQSKDPKSMWTREYESILMKPQNMCAYTNV